MSNKGSYIVSLGNLCRWLGQQAEELGVEVYAGFAGAEVLYKDDGAVCGVATGDIGIGKDGQPTERFARGVELRAKYTLFAEGARGSLTKTLFKKFRLRDGVDPQTFGLGIKELWQIDPARHRPGLVLHTQGWPLNTAGDGSFIYHLEDNQVAIGFVDQFELRQPSSITVRRIPTLQAPSVDPTLSGRRHENFLRCPSDERKRTSIDPKAYFSWGRAYRLCGRFRQCTGKLIRIGTVGSASFSPHHR